MTLFDMEEQSYALGDGVDLAPTRRPPRDETVAEFRLVAPLYELLAGELRRAKVSAVDDWPTLAHLDDDALLGLAHVAAMAAIRNGYRPPPEPAPLQDRPVARNTDPETSHAAALSVGDLRPRQLAVCEHLLASGNMTDEELCVAYWTSCQSWPDLWPAQSDSGIRTRRAELVAAGLAEPTGEKRRMTTGRLAQVWRPTGRARTELAEARGFRTLKILPLPADA